MAAAWPPQVHFPPDRMADAEARAALRLELLPLCAELGCPLAFLTAAHPDTAAGCSGAPPDLVRLAVHEFVRAGFARVGVVRGGYAALGEGERDALVVGEPGASSAGGHAPPPAHHSLAEQAKGKLSAAKVAAQEKLRRLSFSRRRAKPAPA